MEKIFKFLLIISILTPFKIYSAVSLVYNLRIAESTKRQVLEKGQDPYKIALTAFNNNRKKRNGIYHNVAGMLETFSYTTPNFYFRTDFAFGQVKDRKGCSHFKELETDDILFKSGYSYSINEKIKLTLSGLFSIPTHMDHILEQHQLGYGHFGLGFQFDSSFIYSIPRKSAIRCAFRLIQFIPRHTWHTADNITKRYTINIGNLIDVFIAHHTVFGHHSFEFGYDQIFFCNGKIHPFLEDALEKINYIRPEFFSTYKYTIATRRTHHIFSVTFSGGFDIWPWLHGNKRIVETWFSYGINF